MASNEEIDSKDRLARDIDSNSDDKAKIQQMDVDEKIMSSTPTPGDLPAFGPPELIRDMSPEKRLEVEKRLKRKIDLRIMPMIVLMYILNYLDRVSILHSFQDPNYKLY